MLGWLESNQRLQNQNLTSLPLDYCSFINKRASNRHDTPYNKYRTGVGDLSYPYYAPIGIQTPSTSIGYHYSTTEVQARIPI